MVTPEGKAAYADDAEIKGIIECVENELGSDGRVLVRLSGTEPKIKFYLEVHDTLASAEEYDAKNEWAEAKLAAIAKELGV